MRKQLILFCLTFLIVGALRAQSNATKVGEFIIEPPTLENLGFEWYIDGDDNRNARVEVEYQIAGSNHEWKSGMPLLRIGGEHIGRAGIGYTTPHMFAGSILDLKPDTNYEVRFTLEDPDGVQGEGDIIKIHGGLYQGGLLNYPDWHNIPFDGTYWPTAKGIAELPIVIEAAGDGEVIFDGQGAANLFNAMATDHHIFQGLTFRNVDRVFDADRKHLAGASI